MTPHVVIIGAGPAGLTAAYLLTQHPIPVTILEADPHYVGGIARTVCYHGYHIDIGGHRFFSKSPDIEALWSEILPADLLSRPRYSRIYYRNKFFSYPLKPFEVLLKLGVFQSLACVASFVYAQCFPLHPVISFADWVTNRFGRRLYRIFFKSYTEKVWGMRCDDISAHWAAQRIQELSFISVILNNVRLKLFKKNQTIIKTLINTFRYPRKGAGMLWEACAQKIKNRNGTLLMGCAVFKLTPPDETPFWTVHYYDKNGTPRHMTATHIISSAPLRDIATEYLSQQLSPQSHSAALQLQYRDFILVVVILKDTDRFRDNWIYIHSPEVDVARIQNYKSWSPEMIPTEGMTCYGMEYFCFKDDRLWSANDEALIVKAKNELVALGLANHTDIRDSCVIRQKKAYPVYDHGYQKKVNSIRQELEETYPSLFLVGRNGMHMYNNQDHSMMTAMLTVKNMIAGYRQFDVWNVNQDAQYIESTHPTETPLPTGLRITPQRWNLE